MRNTSTLAAVVLLAFTGALAACDDDDELTDIDENGFYTAALTPGAEIPAPVGSPTATGTATMQLDDGELTVVINIAGDLTSGVTMAHIHGPAGTNGTAGILFDFVPAMQAAINAGARTGTILSVTYDLETIPVTAAGVLRIDPHLLIDYLNTGQAYVNVHTGTNPNGEIRGQVVRN